jgi:hypothetical protein
MTRLGIAFWVLLVLASGFATFKVKYAVQEIEEQLAKVRKQTIAEQQEMRVLNAEWTYLNEPERLADLNKRFLRLLPPSAKQLQQKIADIPLRPLPSPPTEPDVVVAANPPAATPQATAPVPAAPAAAPVTALVIAKTAPAVAVAAAAPAKRALPLQLISKANAADLPQSLDALIARVVETR